ncbi:MAG: DNA-binding protein [Phototrophicales bacterium]|nr:MAG: DNA-binding protein [Phototrophicales bacterium]
MPNWLPLKKAAELLGVHPTTLRRWADAGDIPVYVTPGGHRRFLEEDITALIEHQRKYNTESPQNMWTQKALITTQRRIREDSRVKWIEVFDEEERQRQRQVGQRLLGLIMQHISMPEADDRLLIEAQDIAEHYAESCMRQGLSAAQALEIVIFFRDGIVESALQMPQVANYDDENRLRLLRRLNQIFNLLQLTLIKHYEQLSLE